MIDTTIEVPIKEELIEHYFASLVNRFFKILPIRESGEESLPVYMRSLQCELLGCQELISTLNYDAGFITLSSILQYLINTPDCSITELRREVFHAISVCNKIKEQYERTV